MYPGVSRVQCEGLPVIRDRVVGPAVLEQRQRKFREGDGIVRAQIASLAVLRNGVARLPGANQ